MTSISVRRSTPPRPRSRKRRSEAGQRWQYEASQLIPLAFFILLGVVFYALGAPTRRREVVVPPVEPLSAPVAAE
jgi:hypothetical protein